MKWNYCSRIFIKKLPRLLDEFNKFRYLDIFAIVVSLGLLIFGASLLFESANEWVLWKYDDTEHLNISLNFILGQGLTKDFIDLEANTPSKNIKALQQYEEISNPLRSKLPLYFILLGGWLYITSANFTNWYFLGSIFNLTLSSICIVIFYFFIKQNLGTKIAILSTPFLALMPSFLWYSVRIRPDVLAFIFILLSLYFALKQITVRNALICGIFVSMAHFSHPIGLIPGVAIVIYYLMKRKIKEAFVLIGVWCVISLPWLIRNYLVLGDATQGFGLPIPRSILTAIGLISNNSSITNAGDVGSLFGISIINILDGMINEFSNLYGMAPFLLFTSISIVAYINLAYFRSIIESRNMKIIVVSGLALYSSLVIYTAIFESNNINIYRQTTMVFLVPFVIFLYLKLFSHHKNIFSVNAKEILVLSGLVVVITFIPYIMFAQISGRSVPEIRIIIQSLYLMIPISIYGLWRIFENIIPSKYYYKDYLKVSFIILCLVSISTFQLIHGVNTINNLQKSFAEKNFQKELDSWVIENIPNGSKIASDLPHAVLLNTGHPSINFPHAYKDDKSYEEWLIKKFDIDYFVFYYFRDGDTPDLTKVDLDIFHLQKIFQGKEGGLVYKVIEKNT